MVYHDGMALMNKRTTFALDEETVKRLQKMARLLHISQAEVVRKAVEEAEITFNQQKQKKLLILEQYLRTKGLKPETADAYLKEVAENRLEWVRGK